MSLPKNENFGFIGIIIALILVFFYFILGISGAMSVLGIILFFIVPSYIILGNFDLNHEEMLVFAFFIGVGIFPKIMYWLGMFISFKLSIFLAFIIMTASGFAAKHFRRR